MIDESTLIDESMLNENEIYMQCYSKSPNPPGIMKYIPNTVESTTCPSPWGRGSYIVKFSANPLSGPGIKSYSRYKDALAALTKVKSYLGGGKSMGKGMGKGTGKSMKRYSRKLRRMGGKGMSKGTSKGTRKLRRMGGKGKGKRSRKMNRLW